MTHAHWHITLVLRAGHRLTDKTVEAIAEHDFGPLTLGFLHHDAPERILAMSLRAYTPAAQDACAEVTDTVQSLRAVEPTLAVHLLSMESTADDVTDPATGPATAPGTRGSV